MKAGETVKGNVKGSWMQLILKSDKLDFDEFAKISNQFPNLFMPAFRLHQRMMMYIFGERWWETKKQALKDEKELADAKIMKAKKSKEEKEALKIKRKTIRSMGLVRYYLCPCMRKYYDPSRTEYDDLSEEDKLKRDRENAERKRKAELAIKNPETVAWIQYDKKTEEEKQFIPEKLATVERPREIRAETREERRKRRLADPELRLKPRTTISGADI